MLYILDITQILISLFYPNSSTFQSTKMDKKIYKFESRFGRTVVDNQLAVGHSYVHYFMEYEILL